MAEALAAFNRGLAALQADGRIGALYQRYIINPSKIGPSKTNQAKISPPSGR
jgi:ABC-type amino acid transport substrate-binding protein